MNKSIVLKNGIKEFNLKNENIIAMDNVELEFKKDAIEEIVNMAITRDTGARGLRSIVEDVIMDAMYEVPSNKDIVKCTITKDVVLKNKKAIYEYKK